MHETRIAAYGTVASGVGSGAMFTDGYLGASLVLAVLCLVGMAAGLHYAGVKVKPSRSAARRVGTIAAVGLVVSAAALGGPATQPAQAAYGFQDCDLSDSLTGAVIASFTQPQASGECRFNPADVGNPDGVAETDAYASGLAIADATDSYLTTSDNLNNATYGVMLMEAKLSIIQSLEAGENETQAMAAANETIDTIQHNRTQNLLHNWEGHATHVAYLAQTNATVEKRSTGQFSTGGPHEVYANTSTARYEFSGHVYEYETILFDQDDTQAYFYGPVLNPALYNETETVNEADANVSGTVQNYVDSGWGANENIVVSTSAGDSVDALSALEYQNQITALHTQEQQAKANVDQLVSDIYAAHSQGDFNSSDLAESSPLTMATSASTDLDSTGYYGFASAQAAALGISTDTNASHTVRHDWTRFDTSTDSEVTTTVNTTGTLFYTGDDSPALSTGSTIDPANYSGSFYMSVSSIEGINDSAQPNYVQMNGTFEILSATNTQTGEPVNTTTMEAKPEFSTTNTSNLQDQINELQELRQYYEEQQAAGGGIGIDFGGTQTGILIALAAVVILLARD